MARAANFNSRYRPIEYDTFRDPAGPLTASAQVLVASLTSFMIGLADTPREFVLDVISAARAVGHPREHMDRHAACQAAISSLGHSSREDSTESEEAQVEEGQIEDDEVEDHRVLNEGSTQENVADEDNKTYVKSCTPSACIARKRNLQLEKAKPMSSSMTPTKSPKVNVLYEASFHGSKMSKKFLRLIIVLPTDVSLSMARGFHNAPKLYHDLTVNDVPQVIGFRSGFRAAGKVVSAIPAPAWGQVF